MKRIIGFIAVLVLLFTATNALSAGDKKARGRAAWAWSCSSCSESTACTAGECKQEKTATKTETHQKEKVRQTEQISVESCSSGSCGTQTSSRLFRSRGRR